MSKTNSQYFRVSTENRDKFESALSSLYALPGAISRQRDLGHFSIFSVSAGKPWVDYIDEPERVRVRAVEKWRKDDQGRRTSGVVKLVQQFIIPGGGVSEAIFMNEGKIVIENVADESKVDQWVTHRTWLRFLSTQQVEGVTYQVESHANSYVGGYGNTKTNDILQFRSMQLDMELEYYFVKMDETRLLATALEILQFSRHERELDEQRRLLLRRYLP